MINSSREIFHEYNVSFYSCTFCTFSCAYSKKKMHIYVRVKRYDSLEESAAKKTEKDYPKIFPRESGEGRRETTMPKIAVESQRKRAISGSRLVLHTNEEGKRIRLTTSILATCYDANTYIRR